MRWPVRSQVASLEGISSGASMPEIRTSTPPRHHCSLLSVPPTASESPSTTQALPVMLASACTCEIAKRLAKNTAMLTRLLTHRRKEGAIDIIYQSIKLWSGCGNARRTQKISSAYIPRRIMLVPAAFCKRLRSRKNREHRGKWQDTAG